jgi:hypothetical protein
MSRFQQTVLTAVTHLAEGLALKLRWTEKVEKSVMDLEGMSKLTESKMKGQIYNNNNNNNNNKCLQNMSGFEHVERQ